jgi:hypothetical protein
MFGGYAAAKKRKLPAWAAPVLVGAIAIHLGIFLAMWIKTIWDIERLEKPNIATDLATAAPPPPPPPLPKGGAKPQDIIIPHKRTVKDIVQPVKIEKQETKVVEQGVENGSEHGDINGDKDGVDDGIVGGVGGAPPPPPPPPPPPAAPTIVAPTMLEASRIAGEKNIVPEEVTKTDIQRSGKDRVVGSYKLCLNAGGDITSVTQIKSTGFGAYDSKILNTMRTQWKYKPFAVNGKNVPVCTAVTFIYEQK